MKKTLELWADWKAQNRFWRWTALVSLLALLLTVFALLGSMRRPPFVIRVSANGETLVLGPQTGGSKPDEAEARYFAMEFLKLYLAPASKTVGKDLGQALSLMVPELRSEHAKVFSKNRYIKDIERLGIDTSLFFGDVIAKSEGSGHIVTAEGVVETRRQGTLTPPLRRRFSAHVTLVGFPRTILNPQGLYVQGLQVNFEGETASTTVDPSPAVDGAGPG